MYKATLTQWQKGTGGGSGLETEFEKWDEDKYIKYDIDPCSYDHTDIANRPHLLFNMYTKVENLF